MRVGALLFLGVLLLGPFESAPVHGQSLTPESCTEYQRNPVLNDSAGYVVTYPSTGSFYMYNNTYTEHWVLRTPDGYRMWYAGYVRGVWGIYTATSKDGGNWSVNTMPVLTSGPNGTWDSSDLFAPMVLYNGSGYMMYFRASASNIYTRSIGVAFSFDGVHWTQYADNPVLKPGPDFYDSRWLYQADVVRLNGTYYMWYVGQSPVPKNYPNNSTAYFYYEAIDLATSPDGIHWTKYPGNPVFIGAPDEVPQRLTGVGHPDVLVVNGTLVMLYGDGYGIRYAVSHDGTHWTPVGGYLLAFGHQPWESGYVGYASAILTGAQLSLWYYGSSTATQGKSYYEGIGLAYCSLIFVPTKVTTTTTLVSTSVQTVTSVTTVVSTSTATAMAQEVPLLEGTTAVGAALAASLLYLLLKRPPRH